MARLIIPEAEALIDQEIKVLDKGFVRLVDYMGGDSRIVQSARVSYGEGTKTVREDKGLIDYLMKNDHTSPFEQVGLTFHCKMPVFVARQWVRHRTARLNEISGRYSVMKDEFYVPDTAEVRLQSQVNKQGRGEVTIPLEDATAFIGHLETENAATYKHYEEMIESGLARELARINLPLSLYTEWYWQIDLHNLFHFIQLRADAHAQYEIREYALALAQCARAVAPLAYEAFEEHRMYAVKFSRSECRALEAMLEGKEPELEERPMLAFKRKLSLLAPDTEKVL
ncbi:MAG: FAD-dependent thymidylate synthase [Armatimonadetes bacterium]|nr:FAD-dependent thymidylate synthase [Armatimonadota bacterium]